MARPCVEDAAREAGVRPEILTTMADIYTGPTGLPDEAPYNETVVLALGVGREDPDVLKWEAYLRRKFREQEESRVRQAGSTGGFGRYL